jgi:hypothetical protein
VQATRTWTTKTTLMVELRAPRAGERGWWVSAWHDADEALAEVLKEDGWYPECLEEPGWPACRDERWESDENDMRPVTLTVIMEGM